MSGYRCKDMDDSGFQTTRPGYQTQTYYEMDTNLEKLMPKDFECLVVEWKWKNKNCGALPLNQTWDWHKGKEATGCGIKISFDPQNFLMTVFSHRKLQQNNYAATMASASPTNYSLGGGAPINKSRRRRRPQIVGGGAARRGGRRTALRQTLTFTGYHSDAAQFSRIS